MPAAAVIPAPIAYIKVVAVKKLVVELRAAAHGPSRDGTARRRPTFWEAGCHARAWWPESQDFYFDEIRVFKAGSARLNTTAWNNEIGPRFYFVGLKTEVMMDRDSWGHSYFQARGEILGFWKDELVRKHLPRMFPLIKNES